MHLFKYANPIPQIVIEFPTFNKSVVLFSPQSALSPNPHPISTAPLYVMYVCHNRRRLRRHNSVYMSDILSACHQTTRVM